MRNFRAFLFFLVLTAVAFLSVHFKKADKITKPKKVIFLIGDGMGLAQISGAMSFYDGVNAFERFKVIGFSKTSSDDNYVTDSGAGATVFSIGKKTFNGAIGVDKDSIAHENIFEMMKKKNAATGVVVTSSVTHATPACFYAHVSSRKSEFDIAEFLLKGKCDIAIGGGMKFFVSRNDKRNLFDELKAKGYSIFSDTSLPFQNINASKLIYTLSWDGMKKAQEGRSGYLKNASLLAMKNLDKNPEGYFLMVEGSQIDWGGHANDFDYMKSELIDFNEAINVALDYAIKDGNTLVVVTADHETGGLSLIENKSNKKTFKSNYSTGGHSGIMVPVFAFGPGSEEFQGIYENTAIHDKFKQLLNLK
ncbi:MAG: alkaline phosphatase [Bacteroidota bacterium]